MLSRSRPFDRQASRRTSSLRVHRLSRAGVAGVGRVAAECLTRYTTGTMRPIWWIPVFVTVTSCALWVVVYSDWNLQDNPVASRFAIGCFLFISAGPYWMLYDCWQHDKRLTRKMWLFFVPAGFLWYYFERFRPRQLLKRQGLYS